MAIHLTNVRFSYSERPDKLVLDIPSWSIEPGERVFVHGPSGGGKSTLLNLVSGIVPAQAGEVTVLGQELSQMSGRRRDRFRGRQIGYVFQQFNLIPYLSAIDNIRLASFIASADHHSSQQDEIRQLLTALNVAEEDWHSPSSKLSIGQQQRVAIARSLINKPQLLIADEPTSSLDQQNRDLFMSLLMSTVESEGMTLLFVSHDVSLSHYFSRVEDLSALNLAGDGNHVR